MKQSRLLKLLPVIFSIWLLYMPLLAQDPVVLAAGDIASCDSSESTSQLAGARATSSLLDSLSGTILALGDLAYFDGSEMNFARCFDPTWGRHVQRMVPVPGNHEYQTPGAADYYNYFGSAAGDPKKGYYSFNLGAWHVVVVNSAFNCCSTGTAQLTWLQSDLAVNPTLCQLVLFHHPLFSSFSSNSFVKNVWQVLYNAGVDVVLNGHAHNYERFDLQDPNGNADPGGIREFVVGTGGGSHNGFGTALANSQVRNGNTFGVLQLTLHASSYDWQFIPQAGATFTDSGTQSCH